MLKYTCTYETFDGEKISEDLYFHLSETELINMETEVEGGVSGAIEKIVKAQDVKNLVREFQKIILLAYGEKSEDGKRFVKSDKMREEFSQTVAYNKMFMEFSTDEKKAADFFMGILPKSIQEDVNKKLPQDKPMAPPRPPTPSS